MGGGNREVDRGTKGVGGGDKEVEGGMRKDLGGGEGEVITEGARECPKWAKGVREEGWWGAKEDGRGGSWEDVWEVYPWCAWSINCMLLLLLFVYFNLVLYLWCFYDGEIEFVMSTKPHKFKSVGNSKECSWESYGWYKHEESFSANQCSIETTP